MRHQSSRRDVQVRAVFVQCVFECTFLHTLFTPTYLQQFPTCEPETLIACQGDLRKRFPRPMDDEERQMRGESTNDTLRDKHKEMFNSKSSASALELSNTFTSQATLQKLMLAVVPRPRF